MSLFSHDRVMEILADALDLPADRRGAFLDEACGGDALCRAEVERLLAAESTPDLPTINAPELLARSLAAPTHIGRYKIVRELGRGGMGIVYLAEQSRPVRRQVAIKLIQFGLTSPEIIARFDSERQALAMMSHPNIARVFDGGTTDTGRQYFVMEYADGVGITEYCDRNQLNTRQRLDLFLQVCQAVHHAHQKGIIHRDLKPSNVLVTLIDSKPVPKVIDFGIAKAVDRPLTEGTFFTEHGRLMGTPEYMSPEQAAMDTKDIDTRTDVYSLGVLLYELISGVLPFDKQLMKKSAFDELRRLIREVDPPRPSTRLAQAGETAIEIARAHRADHKSLVRTLRGELDWITMRALEKDRMRRYSSVAEFADDVRRYLADEPVLAGPPGTVYRMQKFVRRHSVGVIASSLVVLALVGGIVGVAWQAVAARRAEARARQRFDDVRAIANKLLFDFDNSIMYLPGTLKARQLLVTTALQYLDKLSAGGQDDPDLQNELAQAYIGVGKIQFEQSHPNLNDPKGALASFSKAVSLSRPLAARYPARSQYRFTLALALSRYANTAMNVVSPEEGIAAANEAIELFRPLAAEHPDNLPMRLDLGASIFVLAWAYDVGNQPEQARDHWRESLAYFEAFRKERPDVEIDRWIASNHMMLGRALSQLRQFDEAQSEMETGRALHVEIHNGDPNNTFAQRSVSTCDVQLADLSMARGNHARAAELYLRAADSMEQMYKADPENAYARMELGLNLYNYIRAAALAGQTGAALGAMETRFLPMVRKRYPSGHAALVHYLRNYADLLRDAGRESDARKVEEEIARAPSAATTTSPSFPAHH